MKEFSAPSTLLLNNSSNIKIKIYIFPSCKVYEVIHMIQIGLDIILGLRALNVQQQ